MRTNARQLTAALTVAFAVFMVLVLGGIGAAVAAPAPSSSGSSPANALYGAVRTISVGPLIAASGWVYQGTSTVGYQVNVTEVSVPTSTDPNFELSVERTMGVLFSVEFCSPSCSAPTEYANLSYHAWEVTNSFANFTTQGTVLENGQPVVAIALLNSSSTLEANVTERAESALPNLLGTHLVDRSKYLSAAVSSEANVSFASPLGLLPLDLASAQNWTSSAAFNASGVASYSYYYRAIGPLVNRTIGPNSGQFTVSPSGTVNVTGSFNPSNSVRFNGMSFPAVRIVVSGPFSVREGFILIPSQVDLFSGGSNPWTAEQNGSTTVTMNYLDAAPSAAGLAIGASSWLYTAGATNPGATELGSTASGLAPAVATATDPIASETLQGVPQTTGEAATNQQCLTTGVGCPAAPASTPVLGNLVRDVVVVGVVVVVVAVLAIVLVAERRRVPPPVYPNSTLYPPGAAGARPGARAPEGPAAPPAEDDPLDHLW